MKPSMTSYKRTSRPYYRSNKPTSVSITWSQQYSAYAVKWMDTGHFQEMMPVINFMKSKPYGEYTYDSDNKVWYIAEKYIKDVIVLLEAFGDTIFEINFVEKPAYSYVSNTKTISVDTYLDQFKELTNEDIRNLEYRQAKKIYLRFCMKYHPDLNPDKILSPLVMSKMNEIWTELERLYFKTSSQITYEIPTTS